MGLTLVTFLHVAICVLLILIVLLQHGRGADMGATFGGGSNTLFGASGADNLLTRVTTFLAFMFMASSVYLSSNLKAGAGTKGTLFEGLPQTAPVAPISAPAGEIPANPETAEKGTEAAPQPAAAVPEGSAASGAVPDADHAAPNAPAALVAPAAEAPAAPVNAENSATQNSAVQVSAANPPAAEPKIDTAPDQVSQPAANSESAGKEPSAKK